jgi:phosphatidylserine decarboxylase
MIFQILGHEQQYSFAFTVIDRDKYSGNDFIASVNFPVKDLIEKAPKADPETGLYNLKNVPEFSAPAQRPRFMRLGLSRSSSTQSLSKVTRPNLSKNPSTATTATAASTAAATPALVPGTPQPQADLPEGAQPAVPNTGFLHPGDNAVAAAASTLGETTPPDGEDPEFIPYTLPLKMKNQEKWEAKHNPQLFIRAKYMPYPALRQQFWRAMLKQYDTDESGLISKVELTTMLDTLGSTLRESTIDSFFQRFPHKASDNDDAEDLTMDEAVICLEDQLQAKSRPQGVAERVKNMLPDADKVKSLLVPTGSGTETPAEGLETPSESQTTDTSTISVPDLSTPGEEGDLLDRDDLNISTSEEHVVEIRECPICHQPRLNKRKDADIITHIATCASQDWRQVNNLMMGGFVTSSQAQRKWYSKVITKISYGGYKLGANSANILVQDRMTGQINEEKMSVYVRLGIRLLYKGLKSNNMEKKRSECMPHASLADLGIRANTGQSANSSRASASSRAKSTTTRRPGPRSQSSSPSTGSTSPRCGSRSATSSPTRAPARRPPTRASSCPPPTAAPSSSTASRRPPRSGSRAASSASSASWGTRTRRTWRGTRRAAAWAFFGWRRRTTTASTSPSTASCASPRPSPASTTRSTPWPSAPRWMSTARTCASSCPSTRPSLAASWLSVWVP